MLAFLKKGADVVIKAAITPTTSKLPHQESVGKYLTGTLKSIMPGQKGPVEKNFDLKMHNRTYKLGVELPGSTRTVGYENEVAMKVPSYKLPYKTMQKFAAWQEQNKEGDVEETYKDPLVSLINPTSTVKEFVKRKTADHYFERLKELDTQLKKIGGNVVVDSTPGRYKQGLTIELDVSGKSIKEIEKDVALVLQSLDISDQKLVKTFSQRLYKSCTDPKMSSADIKDKKNPTTDSRENSDANQDQDITSPSQECNQNQDIISSASSARIADSDFSLTNSQSMPHTRNPLQSSQMLQQLQNQILMQQKSERTSSQPMSHTIQQEVNNIAGDLAQGLESDIIQGNTTDNMRRSITNSTNTGKAHAR